MGGDKPRVSIGLPVFNGEHHLAQALDAILAQTHSDFELIISDNASTDRTPEICQTYAAGDPRIRYYRNAKNLGAAPNFNRAFELASGEYFKWAAHDDVIAPDFLLKCVEVLEQDPSVVLCHSKVKFIGVHGEVLKDYDITLNNVGSPRPQDRFGDLILVDHWCLDVFGLIRASALRKTPIIGSYVASDRVLLAELGLLGRFYQIPEHLFLSREHTLRSIRTMSELYMRAAWFDSRKERQIVLPQWRIFAEYVKAIQRVPLNRHERTCCYKHICSWLRLYWKSMIKDLVVRVPIQFWHNWPRRRAGIETSP
jgi:glycosyltransferase involved in cell wall biosynthesis